MRKMGALFVGLILILLVVASCGPAATPTPTPPPAAIPTATPTPKPTPTPVPTPTPAPTATPVPKFQRGGTLTIAHTGDFNSLNALESRSAYDSIFTFNVYDRLLHLDKDWAPVPGLAVSWQITDPKTVVFSLKKGVKFHDGTDFNAQAVKFTYDYILNPETKGFGYGALSKFLDGVDVKDDYTAVFRLKTPFAPLLSAVAAQGTEIVSPAAMQKLGKADFGRMPVGSGPFKFVEWITADHVTVDKSDGYWGKDPEGNALPYLDRVIYKIIPDETVRVTAVRTGTADVAVRVPTKDIEMLMRDTNVVLLERAAPGVYELRINNQMAPLNIKEARQALAYATDREAIVKAIFSGRGEVGKAQRGPATWDWDPTIPVYPPDLEKAKKKLADAGYPSGFTIKVTSRNEPWSILLAEMFQNMYAKIGVKVEINLVDIAQLATELFERKYQTSIGNTPGAPDPHSDYWQYSSKSGSYPDVKNPRVDEIIDKGMVTYDLQERKKIYQELARLLVDESPKIFLAHSPETALLTKRVQGFDLYPYPYHMNLAKVWIKR